MNIAMVVYSHYSRDARVRRYAEALARRGFKVDVVCLKEDYLPKEANISLIQYPLPRKRFGRLWYLFEYFLFFIYSTILLTINYYQKKYKVIHIHNMPDILAFTAIVPKIFGTKIILDMHDPMPELYMSKYHLDRRNLGVKVLTILEQLSFHFADLIITANPEFKKIFLLRTNIPQNKISVILNCPDPRIFQPKNRKSKGRFFTLLYMGTVDERFGLDIAIDAIPLITEKIPNFKFIIIPKLEEEGEYFEILRNKIIKNQLSPYVSIESPLPLEKVAKKIEEADIGIVLAKNGVFTDNIFPVKMLEFIQMNVPVIATKTKILSKYFTNKMIYFLHENIKEEFADAVITLCKDKRLQENLFTHAKEYLKRYNWEKEEKKYLELATNLIK